MVEVARATFRNQFRMVKASEREAGGNECHTGILLDRPGHNHHPKNATRGWGVEVLSVQDFGRPQEGKRPDQKIAQLRVCTPIDPRVRCLPEGISPWYDI